jgi:hypothetical protein
VAELHKTPPRRAAVRAAAAKDVGFDDVEAVLAKARDGKGEEWFSLRSRLQRRANATELEEALLRAGVTDAGRRRVRAWISAGCPRWRQSRYADYFFDLDAWSEYWDIYRPETRGRYHFGDGSRDGYLSAFLPTPRRPRAPVFEAWKAHALTSGEPTRAFEARRRFEREVSARSEVADAVVAVDRLVQGLANQHFRVDGVLEIEAYLDAIERFACDTLPERPERYQRIPDDDPRKPYSLRHRMAGDIMWFAWAVHLEAVQIVAPATPDEEQMRALLMAGVAFGCSMDYAFSGRCRTRREYEAGGYKAWRAIWKKGRELTSDFDRAAAEVRSLFFIRAYGDD